MRDLSYLEVFSPKILREARRVLNKGFTAKDISDFLEKQARPKPSRRGFLSRTTKVERDIMKGRGFLERQPCKRCGDRRKVALLLGEVTTA